MSSTTSSSRTAWESALADLELHVGDVEHALAGGWTDGLELVTWTAPVGLGPLPAELEERARVLLIRQQHVLKRLAAATSAVRGELALVTTIGADSRVQTSPSFLDVGL